MALELFKPFVMKRLVDAEYAQNIKSAKRMVERRRPQVWDVLEGVIKEHPVLLNRAPTLHRLGIQAFEPVLVEGKAIQVHPLVCTAFNADFDGDQMAVHLPLSAEAQAEARVLMLSANNILSPATGRPITVPTQDMVFGIYYLTLVVDGAKGEGRAFRHAYEVEAAFDAGDIDLQAKIMRAARGRLRPRPFASCWPRGPRSTATATRSRPTVPMRMVRARGDGHGRGRASRAAPSSALETTPGRLFFNGALPPGYRYVNDIVGKRNTPIGAIVEEVAANFTKAEVAASLDRIKDLGFRYAAQSGLTISIDDVRTPPDKQSILDRYEKEADKAETQFKRGIITDDERRQKEIEIWTSANSEVGKAMEASLSTIAFNPLDMMVDSGARGNSQQIRQIAGMKGLVSNPRGEMIPRPIKSSFREGPVRPRVLHLDPRRPQGTGRHRPAHGRLGLPDPATRRRGPGAHRPRGGLRVDPWHLDRGRRPRQPGHALLSRDPRLRPGAGRAGDPGRQDARSTPAPSSPRSSSTSCATTPRSPGCGCARCSPARPNRASARPATASRWPPAG